MDVSGVAAEFSCKYQLGAHGEDGPGEDDEMKPSHQISTIRTLLILFTFPNES